MCPTPFGDQRSGAIGAGPLAENKAALATQVPLGRLGLSEEVADGIVFIASDEARFITGHVLKVDGGHSAN
jgi:NAD(P)-dependent dehydrogenase (short-subunit alcohol dehydrogenase family)